MTKIITTGHNLTITKALSDYAETHATPLFSHCRELIRVRILIGSAEGKKVPKHKVTATGEVPGNDLIVTTQDPDAYKAIHSACKKLARAIRIRATARMSAKRSAAKSKKVQVKTTEIH
jgi:ribosomal subunit interface protein